MRLSGDADDVTALAVLLADLAPERCAVGEVSPPLPQLAEDGVRRYLDIDIAVSDPPAGPDSPTGC